MKKSFKDTAFAVVAALFSTLSLAGVLWNSIAAEKELDAATLTEQKCVELHTEINRLRVEYDNSLSLTELEEYAENVLGMKRCQPEQIIYIDMDE